MLYAWPDVGQQEGSVASSRLADQIRRNLGLPTYSLAAARDAAVAEVLAAGVVFPGLMGPVFNVVSFGAVSGGPDCTPARDAATAAAIAAGGGVVYYPAGFWYHLTQPTALTGTVGVIYQGAGRNATSLVMGADGLAIFDLVNATRVILRDMWIGSFAVRASGWGIRSINPGYPLTPTSELILEHVTLQNLPSPLHYDNVAQAAMRDIRHLQSLAGATVGPVFKLIRSVTHRLVDIETMCITGTMPTDVIDIDSDCDTIIGHRIAVSFFTNGGGNGIRFRNSVGGGATGPRLCRMTDCYVENAGSHGFLIEDARDVRLRGCHAAACTLSGFAVTGGDSPTIEDCFATLNQQHGYAVTGGDAGKISGCTATDNSQQTHNTYDGIHLEVNVVDWRVRGNKSGDFIYATGKKQRYGIYLGAGTSDYLTVRGNHMQGNQTGALANFSTGAHNDIEDGIVAYRIAGKPFALTDAATIATVDPRLGTVFTVTLGGNRTMGVALDGANWIAGQRITFLITQDGTGGRTLAWHGSYKVVWSNAGNTAGLRSIVSFINAGDGTWAQDGAQTPYV